jgi:hypothetical protein
MSTSSLSKSHSSNSLDSNDQEHQKKLSEQKGQIGDSKLQQSNKPENARENVESRARGKLFSKGTQVTQYKISAKPLY